MIYKFAFSNGEIQLANALSQKDYLSMLDQIPDLDINNAVVGTYNGKLDIAMETGAIPSEKQLEYIINYDLYRHADGFSLKMEQGAQYKYSFDGQNLDVWKVNDATGDPHHFEKIGPGHDVNAEGRIYYYNPDDIFQMIWVNRGTPRLNRLAIPLVRQWCLQNLGAAPTYVGEETDEAIEKNAAPEDWGPMKIEQLDEPYDFQMPKTVEDIFVHNMECPECKHNLRQAPGGVYCEYCGWTPRVSTDVYRKPMTRDHYTESSGAFVYYNGRIAWAGGFHYEAFDQIVPNNYDETKLAAGHVLQVWDPDDVENPYHVVDFDAQDLTDRRIPMAIKLDALRLIRRNFPDARIFGGKWAASVEDTEPPYNFGFMKEPHSNLYPAAWTDNEKMRPEANNAIKQHVLKQLAINHYDDADDWIYFTVYGSGASYNWDEDGDFDVQMWIDFEAFNDKHPNAAFTSDDLLAEVRRVVQMVNFPSFKDLGLDTPECEGMMLIQFYPKPGKGTPEENLSSKPYACYDLETDEWLQKPRPITPTFYGEHFIMVFNKATDIAVQAESLLDELQRNTVNWQFWSQMYNTFHNDKYETIANDSKRNAEAEKEGIKVLFQGVFGERQKAYSPEGEGIEDEGDITQKLLEVWGIFQRLKHFARQPLPWEEQELPKEPVEEEEAEAENDKESSRQSDTHIIHPQWNFFSFSYVNGKLYMTGDAYHYELAERFPEVEQAMENEHTPQVWGQVHQYHNGQRGIWYGIDWYSDYLEEQRQVYDEETDEYSGADSSMHTYDAPENMKKDAAQAISDRLGAEVKSDNLWFEPKTIAKVAGWSDIMEDALELRNESGVQITHNGANHVEGIVQSQSSPGTTYATSFDREDPNSQAITQWTCTCPWGEVSWGRTRQWKKYEGRPCKHLLAMYWQSLATPLDEERPEAQGQGQLFNPQQIAQPGPAPLVPGAGPTPAQVPNAAPPGTPQGIMPLPPTGVGVAPPPPPAQSQITKPGQGGTVSLPGTLSKLKESEAAFQNTDTVRNKVPMYGTTRDGYTMLVPASQRGTVLFSDEAETIAIFPLDQAGILEPHLVRVQEPTEQFVGAKGDPFVQRRSKLLHYR